MCMRNSNAKRVNRAGRHGRSHGRGVAAFALSLGGQAAGKPLRPCALAPLGGLHMLTNRQFLGLFQARSQGHDGSRSLEKMGELSFAKR